MPLLRLGLPSLCDVCDAPGRRRICGGCLARFAPPLRRCPHCAEALPDATSACGRCLQRPAERLDAAVAAWPYAFPWDHLVQRYKFHAALDLGPALAEAVSQAARAHPDLPCPDVFISVPLAPQRLGERGYNQAHELARLLARHWRRPCRHDWLQRLRETAPQAHLPRQARRHNVRHAFWVPQAVQEQVRGRCIAIVDDVMTTGHTLEEAARALRHAGATHVQGWVVCRA